ncbi:Hypothetical protein NTJ_06155 [Nesidiocoris tenuis]|uniref:Uncharacterized protein n=1 Tax=Nesidiocoris tenuis TaxID=355587 RepID=A0ABN7AR13_9HEMI|nr:Hypothetical protein NTJ_06155 [Nesidiocoris tenuis]
MYVRERLLIVSRGPLTAPVAQELIRNKSSLRLRSLEAANPQERFLEERAAECVTLPNLKTSEKNLNPKKPLLRFTESEWRKKINDTFVTR